MLHSFATSSLVRNNDQTSYPVLRSAVSGCANVVARGFGKMRPIADNNTAAGRKLNRRVEMIVSGDVIGNVVGAKPGSSGIGDTKAPQATTLPVSAPQNPN